MDKIVLNTWPRLLTVEMTAAYIGLAEKTLRNRLGPKAEDPFPVKCKRIGRKVLFDRKDLDEFADNLNYE